MLRLPIEPIKLTRCWRRYRDTNPVPNKLKSKAGSTTVVYLRATLNSATHGLEEENLITFYTLPISVEKVTE